MSLVQIGWIGCTLFQNAAHSGMPTRLGLLICCTFVRTASQLQNRLQLPVSISATPATKIAAHNSVTDLPGFWCSSHLITVFTELDEYVGQLLFHPFFFCCSLSVKMLHFLCSLLSCPLSEQNYIPRGVLTSRNTTHN